MMNGTSALVSDALLLSVEKILQCRNLTDVFLNFVQLLTSTVTLASACTCSIVLNQRMAFVLLGSLFAHGPDLLYMLKRQEGAARGLFIPWTSEGTELTESLLLSCTPCGVHSFQNGCRLMINLHSLGPFLHISKIAFLSCAGGPDTEYSF